MAELRRLGKRGSYRLGRRRPPAGPGRPYRPRQPYLPVHRGLAAAWLLGGLAGAGVIAAGAVVLDWWFLPFAVGVAAGAAARAARLRVVLPSVLVIAAAGWAGPLAWAMATGLPERAVARTVAALAGLPAHASVVLALTAVVAMLQAAAGLWVGRALAPRRGRWSALSR